MLVAGVLFLLLPLLVAAVVPASLAFLAGSTGTGLSSYSSGSSSSSSSSPSSSSSTPRAETINHHNMFNRDPFQNRRNSKRAAPLKAIYRFYFLFLFFTYKALKGLIRKLHPRARCRRLLPHHLCTDRREVSAHSSAHSLAAVNHKRERR